ncbi:P-loop containing nucleoside triphosphate hydrolase protein [Dioscorea alata]|uniref:P-loop containing nucleoside triphosphate hydrolase protein n=1 Tax=Dioscorea alata TaxID=55571 RepID=A0ACB7WL29_DIOAL|nr:P-loop containing nucleoside triphosphate hydrolase protein [Dioscorea alata]
MAESVASQVLHKLSELVVHEAIFLFGVRKKFEGMKAELEYIKCFLRDADAKKSKNKRVEKWVRDIIDVSYQAEDAIDSFLLLVQQPTQFPCFLDCITSITPCKLMERHRIGVELDKIKERIKEIKSLTTVYGIQSLGDDAENVNTSVRRRHSPPQAENVDMVGRHDVHEEMSKQLIDKQELKLCLRCIYGTGGLGKTTVARKIFQNNVVREHFSLRIWIVVTHFSGGDELLAKLIQDVTEHKYVCDLVRRLFGFVMNGSRVLVTTRSKDIAKQQDPNSCELRFLNDDESVDLLLKKAFPYQNVETSCPKELIDLAPRLAKKCGGLPLALSVLGGHLSGKEKTPYVWKDLEKTMEWASQGKECQDILALSYDALEYDLKPCFLYFGMFPQDHVISVTRLVKLWVAEGFVKDEDQGEGVLEALIQRSLVQVYERRPDESVKTCIVHDLLLELAKNEAEKDGFLKIYTGRASSYTNARRLAVHYGSDNTDMQIHDQSQTILPGLRTLMQIASLFEAGDSLLFNSKLLTVLELRRVQLPSRFSEEIKSMKHLRYLGLQETGVRELPTSICELQNLQTIDLRNWRSSCKIPSTLFKIKTLRHVQTDAILRPPSKLVLHDLRTLETVATNWIQEWKFPKLRKLSLAEVDRFPVTALVTLLAELNQLVVLKISSTEGSHIPSKVDLMAFEFHNNLRSLNLNGIWPGGDAFTFPKYLTKLYLEETRLEQDPMPKLEKLPYLGCLVLFTSSYTGKSMMCTAGGFPRLEVLYIVLLYALEEWKVEEDAMPKLKHLRIWDCRMLNRLPELQHVTGLQTLEMYMPKEFLDKLQNDTGEDWYKIKHIFAITFQ